MSATEAEIAAMTDVETVARAIMKAKRAAWVAAVMQDDPAAYVAKYAYSAAVAAYSARNGTTLAAQEKERGA